MLYTIEQLPSLHGSKWRIKDPNGRVVLQAIPTSWASKWHRRWSIRGIDGKQMLELDENRVVKPITQLLQDGQPIVTMKGRMLTGYTVEFHLPGDYKVHVDDLTRTIHFLQDNQLTAYGRPVDFHWFRCYEADIQPGADPTLVLAVVLMAKTFLI